MSRTYRIRLRRNADVVSVHASGFVFGHHLLRFHTSRVPVILEMVFDRHHRRRAYRGPNKLSSNRRRRRLSIPVAFIYLIPVPTLSLPNPFPFRTFRSDLTGDHSTRCFRIETEENVRRISLCNPSETLQFVRNRNEKRSV